MVRCLFGGAKSAPVPLPGDRVVPMNSLDDNALVHNTTLVVSFVFDALLDPEKLRDSLESLIKRDGWQKLGARIRYNVRDMHTSFETLPFFFNFLFLVNIGG